MRGFTALLRFGSHAFAFALGAVAAVADLPAQSAGARAVVTATEVATSGGPAGLVGAAVAPLPGGDSLLFGGAGASGVQGITYRLSGSAWTTLSPQVSPAARTDAAMVLDSARSSLLLFGGKNVLGQPLGDTWSFANGQWAQVPTPVAPPARSGHRMAFDPTGNRVLLFGGEDAAGNAFGDFWEWTGTAWNQLFPSTLPLWRSHFGMDWDRVRGRLVLFGGRAGTTRRDDLWEWNGTTWSPVLIQPNQGVVHAPSARDRLAMAWDPLSERIVLHGGDTASGCASDLWSWNGTEWTVHLPTGTSPSARGSHALWYDGRANQLRLFGGLCGTSLAGDLWSLTLPVTWRSSAYGQGCAGSAGIPIFSVRPGGEALLGQTLVCDLTSVPTTPSNPAFGLYDLQRTTFLGQSIPVSLAFTGLPGCDAWTGGSWSVQLPPMQAGVGTSLSVALPNANALLGVSLYLQSLVFDNSNGRWASMSNGLEVRIGNPIPAPVASFTASPVAGSVPLVVQFTDTSAHAPTSWQWDFDNDGVVDSTVQNPTYTYATAGLFSVRLVASSAAGADTSLRPNLVLAYSSQNPNPALNLMPIAAGTFQMGSVAVGGAAMPVHAVTITQPFWMAKYEVTQAQYQSVMGNNPSAFQGASYPDAANRPVERVSWNMAVAYCAALTAAESAAGRVPAGYQYRLPTEAEWEYCCRAGTTTEWNTGSSLSCAQANIYPCVNQTRAVGVYAANAWGLHDMHGNIWEWCLDAWDGSSTYPSSAVTDPHGSSGPFRIYRGGGWGDVSAYSRSAIRVMVEPLARGHGLGFRVVLAPVLVP